jgi:ABC-type transporter Mla subunit MlaD
MNDERIQKTKSAMEAAEHIPPAKKTELLGLLSKLKLAVSKVAQTHEEDAKSIARLIEASAHEATRKKKRPEVLKTVLRGLKQSVENFRSSHPELVAFVTEYSGFLSEMGL